MNKDINTFHNVTLIPFNEFIHNDTDNTSRYTICIKRKSENRDLKPLLFDMIIDTKVLKIVQKYMKHIKDKYNLDSGFGYVKGERVYIPIVRTHYGKNHNLDIPIYFFVAYLYRNKIDNYNIIENLLRLWIDNIKNVKTEDFNKYDYIHKDGNLHNYTYNNISFEKMDKDAKKIAELRILNKFYHDKAVYNLDKYNHIENRLGNYVNDKYIVKYGPSISVATQCQNVARKMSKLCIHIYLDNGKSVMIHTKAPRCATKDVELCKSNFDLDLGNSTEKYLSKKFNNILNSSIHYEYCYMNGKDKATGKQQYSLLNIHTMKKYGEKITYSGKVIKEK